MPSQNLDFFMVLGDAAYEDGFINRLGVEQPAASPPVDPLNTSETSKSAIKNSVATMATKYRANLEPDLGNLAPLYRAQAIYSIYDNHEMLDSALESGGAPRKAITSFVDKRGKNAIREGVDFDPTNTNNMIFNRSESFINKTPEHQALLDLWLRYMPIEKPKVLNTPNDPRTDKTYKLYNAQQWGKNAVLITVDDRSYRDAKWTQLKPKGSGFDEEDYTGTDSNGATITEALQDGATDAKERTILGATQLSWLKKTLLQSEKDGTTWKIIAISSPIDITGRISDGKDPKAVNNSSTWVDAKSWWGNYRYERNNLLQFIDKHKIKNVVFLSTDDHEARVNELSYAPEGVALDDVANYKIVPGALSVVSSPIGASRPAEGFVGRDITGLSQTLATNYRARGLDPIGLSADFPGLMAVRRQSTSNHAAADTNNPQPIDFWSPDTFNYAILDINKKGMLDVSIQGIPAYQATGDAESWRSIGSPSDASEIFGFTLQPI